MPARRPPGQSPQVLQQWLGSCLGRGDLAPLAESDVAALVEVTEAVDFAGGTFVFRRGDPAETVYVVQDGLVELTRGTSGHKVTLQLLRPGDVLGDIWMILGEKLPFDAGAVEDSKLLCLDARDLVRLIGSRPNLARRWLVSVAERMAATQARVGELLAGDLESQAASLLVDVSSDGVVYLSQERLAQMLGVRRSSVNGVLGRLAKDGLISLGYRRITLDDPTGLAARICR